MGTIVAFLPSTGLTHPIGMASLTLRFTPITTGRFPFGALLSQRHFAWTTFLSSRHGTSHPTRADGAAKQASTTLGVVEVTVTVSRRQADSITDLRVQCKTIASPQRL